MQRPTQSQLIKGIEWITSILLSLVVLVLLIIRAAHAGALWRDEADSVQLGRLFLSDPLFLTRGSFPFAFYTAVYLHQLFFGLSDLSWRCFGLATGVGLTAIAWFNARSNRGEVPLLFLALVGLNYTFLVWGTTIRGYGPGSVLIVLAFGLVARFVMQPRTFLSFLMLVVFAVAMHFLFFNAPTAGAILAGATVVFAFRRHSYKPAMALLGIGLICAVSYIPYLERFTSPEMIIMKTGAGPSWLWPNLFAAFGQPGRIMPAAWICITTAAVLGGAWRLWTVRKTESSAQNDLLLFALLTVGFLIVAYATFLLILRYAPHPWYYLALICLLAAAIDLIVGELCRFQWVRVARLVVVIVAMIALPVALWPKLIERQTNIDVIAQELQKQARPNDLIVLNPWYLAFSFNWYYRGATPWLTVPVVEERRIQRNDLFKAKMMATDPLADLLEPIKRALQSGNRVWIVGGSDFPPDGQEPLVLPPAPGSQYGWDNNLYRRAWSQELAIFADNHSVTGRTIQTEIGPVNDVENVPVWVLEGWRD